jgi:hypothetical protein
MFSSHAGKTCTEPVCPNWYGFGAISASLHQFCPVEQLCSARLRATFERKLKYETVHRMVYPESLPVAGLPAAGGLEACAVPAGLATRDWRYQFQFLFARFGKT